MYIIKQEGLYQKRSTPASFPPVTVKWAILQMTRKPNSIIIVFYSFKL